MNKKQLPQIKIFQVSDYTTTELLEKAINEYIIKNFDGMHDYPRIDTNSSFISVIGERLVEINS